MPVYPDAPVPVKLRTRRTALLLLLALFGVAGCTDTDEQILQLQRQNRQLEHQLSRAQQTIADHQDTIAQKDQQITTLSDLGPERLKTLFQVRKIELGRYTGGSNLNDTPGDEGVRVYLMPKDQNGRTVTAVGSVDIDVFDLAEKDQPLLMSYSFSAAEAKEHFRVGGLANHYSFTCPWKDVLPTGKEITIRVKFIDYLTGQSFTATKQCLIRRPGLSRPAAAE